MLATRPSPAPSYAYVSLCRNICHQLAAASRGLLETAERQEVIRLGIRISIAVAARAWHHLPCGVAPGEPLYDLIADTRISPHGLEGLDFRVPELCQARSRVATGIQFIEPPEIFTSKSLRLEYNFAYLYMHIHKKEDIPDCSFRACNATFHAWGPTKSNTEWQAVSIGLEKVCILVCAQSLSRCIRHATREMNDCLADEAHEQQISDK